MRAACASPTSISNCRQELIAQQPPAERGQSRMLVMDRATGALRDAMFAELPSLLAPGDLLVLNDSRVIPARLYARRTLRREREKPTGRIEVMLTEPAGENRWRALVRPGRKVAIGERLVFPAPHRRDCARSRGAGARRSLASGCCASSRWTISSPSSIASATCRCRLTFAATMPMPIASATRRSFRASAGSVAAPTAGLHFTPQMLEAMAARGRRDCARHAARGPGHLCAAARGARGRGAPAPRALHAQRRDADAVNRAVREGRRIVAVGTTVVRTLEHCARDRLAAARSRPTPARRRSSSRRDLNSVWCGALLTNFHLPQSSLLMLVSAFAGRERVLAAYRHAVEEKYRFFSYGDCMFH